MIVQPILIRIPFYVPLYKLESLVSNLIGILKSDEVNVMKISNSKSLTSIPLRLTLI